LTVLWHKLRNTSTAGLRSAVRVALQAEAALQRGWCRGDWAQDRSGRPVNWDAPAALVQRVGLGTAIDRAGLVEGYDAAMLVFAALRVEGMVAEIEQRAHDTQDVLAALGRARQRIEEELHVRPRPYRDGWED
jgi:hypothetical protein